MRTKFVKTSLENLAKGQLIKPWEESIVASCASLSELSVLSNCRFSHITLAGLDPCIMEGSSDSVHVAKADAMNLPFPDQSFDWSMISDGLHHCSSPHRALTELYRVSRKGVLVFESRDSFVQRVAELILWPHQSYEISAVEANGWLSGGVDNSSIPNYVYRWTEREFEKTISSFNPAQTHVYKYFYDLNLPVRYPLVSAILHVPLKVLSFIMPRQCNSFCMIVIKTQSVHPWVRA